MLIAALLLQVAVSDVRIPVRKLVVGVPVTLTPSFYVPMVPNLSAPAVTPDFGQPHPRRRYWLAAPLLLVPFLLGGDDDRTHPVVPEPGTATLIGLGLILWGVWKRQDDSRTNA